MCYRCSCTLWSAASLFSAPQFRVNCTGLRRGASWKGWNIPSCHQQLVPKPPKKPRVFIFSHLHFTAEPKMLKCLLLFFFPRPNEMLDEHALMSSLKRQRGRLSSGKPQDPHSYSLSLIFQRTNESDPVFPFNRKLKRIRKLLDAWWNNSFSSSVVCHIAYRVHRHWNLARPYKWEELEL